MLGLILTTAMLSIGGAIRGHSPAPAPARPSAEPIERAVVQDPGADADKDGIGWTLIELDLDVTIVPGDANAMIEGEMTLRLDGELSLGPTIAINSRAPLMRFANRRVLPRWRRLSTVPPSTTQLRAPRNPEHPRDRKRTS